jgi:hypothetical protein
MNAVRPYGAYGIQEGIIFMVCIVLCMQSVFSDSTIFPRGPVWVSAPDPGDAAFSDATEKDNGGES